MKQRGKKINKKSQKDTMGPERAGRHRKRAQQDGKLDGQTDNDSREHAVYISQVGVIRRR